MNQEQCNIDFVITWVDGSDPEWQKVKAEYNPDKSVDASHLRYRDWDILKYWFRAVEKFAPWVRKIHFITFGHLPEWLNTNNPKLNIVRHEDYLPKDALPCFNSNAIELSMHLIDDLSEQFVYFNDDMFLLKSISPEDFFVNGLPVDDAVLSPVMPIWGEEIGKTSFNNVNIINKYFNKNEVIKKYRSKFLNLRYGKQLLRTICLLPWRHFSGFYNDHLPIAYLKSTFKQVWDVEHDLLAEVTQHRFRCYHADVSHWLMRYWQFCTGSFIPASPKRGADLEIDSPNTLEIIKNQSCKMFCINDKIDSEDDFKRIKLNLQDAFEHILPYPCSFEKRM